MNAKQKERQAWRHNLLLLGPIGVLALLAVFVVIELALPYRPYVFYNYQAMPPVACQGEPVTVQVEDEILKGYGVKEARVEYYWQRANNGHRELQFGGEVALQDLDPHPRQLSESLVIQSVPIEPGSWKLVTKREIYGQRLLLPDRQELVTETDQVLTVLPEDAPQCRGKEDEL